MQFLVHSVLCRPLRRWLYSSLLTAVTLIACCILSAQAAPGDLDTTFGTGGKVMTPVSSSTDRARAMVIQPDGRIVAAGPSGSTTADSALVRYNSNGSLDDSFGTNGKILISNIGMIYALALQPDGKLVAAGFYNFDFSIERFNNDGSLDSAFGIGGKVRTIMGNSQAFAVAIQADGKIVVAGNSGSGTSGGFTLMRYKSDGSLDSSFGKEGKAATSLGSASGAFAVVIQPDGKIVAAGQGTYGFGLVRYNPNGSLDISFGTDGKVDTSLGDNRAVAFATVIQLDGKIVAAGRYDSNSQNRDDDFALARYNTDGSLDTNFGAGGKIITPITNSRDEVHALAIQPDCKIIAAGSALSTGFALTRYNISGSLDSNFGIGGKVITSNNNEGHAVAIQPDGKLVMAGSSSAADIYGDFALVRYQGLATTTTVNASDVIISEFRFNGPTGVATDEFVELYNTTNNDIMVSDPNGGAGWLLTCINGAGSMPQRGKQLLRNSKLSNISSVASSSFLIPNGTTLPAHRHFLIANTGFSMQTSGGINHAFPDLALTLDLPDNGGIALYNASVSTGTRLDAVGFSTVGDAQFYEGTPLTPISAATANEQYSFSRKINNEVVQDTDTNATDFILISPTAAVGGTPAALGAAGPEKLFAPIYQSPIQISGQYLDPTASSTAQPNRVSENGILKIRRTYTNNTGVDVRRLRFRVFDLTTLNNTQGVPAPVADLRVISSQNETLNTAFGNKTALALTREEPPDQMTTALDGGLHSTLSADTVTLTNPLRAGQSINVGYWLRIVAGGRFRFFVNIEALP